MDDLRARISFQRDIRDCNIFCLTETWLTPTVPDTAVTPSDNFSVLRMDRTAEAGKTKGGGVCFMINKKWCDPRNISILSRSCSPHLEPLSIICCPFYLPREFTSIIVTAVYIPPQATETVTIRTFSNQKPWVDRSIRDAVNHRTAAYNAGLLTSIMRQDPSQGYSHKELAKITGSLSHTLIATLILSDKHAAQRQQELTNAQRRIEQLEREAQERQEGTDEVGQGTEEEINMLKETLAATSHEMEQIKEDFADRADKLQYAEKLLDKAEQHKNSRIKALEAHLAESRNEISRLTRQLDYVTEESDIFQEELKHAYELRHEPSRTGRAPTAPLPSRTKSPVRGLTREHKTEGVVLKHSPAPSEELYITTEPKQSAAASRRSSHGLDLKDLDKLARNVGNFNPKQPKCPSLSARY